MLRIQSLAFTSRSESTRTSHPFLSPDKHQSICPISAASVDPMNRRNQLHHKNDVTSLDKRDRQSLFQEPVSLPIPQAPPPTFLFLLIFNCQKTDQIIQSYQSPKPETRKPQTLISVSANPETLERKTSSPAAPPPSFSEWAYRSNHLS
jgi:hypothetical protein